MSSPHRTEVLVSHANARLTVHARLELVRRVVQDGRPVAHVAAELNCSRATGYKWLRRWREQGPTGLVDRPSIAHRLPRKTPAALEARIIELRHTRKLGPARIAPLVGVAASTVHAVLTRHRLHRLAWLDRPTGQLVRRYERAAPGELIHIDVIEARRLRDGGGWRVHGRDSDQFRRAPSLPRSATTTSIARSMITAAWLMPKSSPTKPRPRAPDSCCGQPRPSAPTASTASSG